MKQVVEHARHDLHALQEGAGGVDGILFSNEFSLPYQCPVDPIAPAAMGRIIGELMSEITKPYGVDLESDPMAAIDLAAAVDAKFIRGTFLQSVQVMTSVFHHLFHCVGPFIQRIARERTQMQHCDNRFFGTKHFFTPTHNKILLKFMEPKI